MAGALRRLMARFDQRSLLLATINSVLAAIIGYAVFAWWRHRTVDWSDMLSIVAGTATVEAWIWWRKKEKASENPLDPLDRVEL